MKNKKIVAGSILAVVLVIAVILIVVLTNGGDKDSGEIKEGKLSYEMKQTGTYQGAAVSDANSSAVAFRISCQDMDITADTYNGTGKLRVNTSDGTELTDEKAYGSGEAEIAWVPEGTETGYLYLTMKQEGNITGLIVFEMPATSKDDTDAIYETINEIAAISFEKQDGNYQKVTREYITKRVKELINNK